MIISHSDQDFQTAKGVVEAMLTAPIFCSEGEVQTLTGYTVKEYRALSDKLRGARSLGGLSRDEYLMIHQGANTLAGGLAPVPELYEKLIGAAYDERMQELIAQLNPMIDRA